MAAASTQHSLVCNLAHTASTWNLLTRLSVDVSQIQVPCSSHCGSASTVSAAQADQAPNSSASGSPRLLLHFTASLLQLRGSTPSTSPLRDANGNILCFNGEIFGGLDMAASSNDGKCLLAGLGLCKTAEQLVSLLSGLRGPWSLIYWQQETKLLWIARDWLGELTRADCACWFFVSQGCQGFVQLWCCLAHLQPWHSLVSQCNNMTDYEQYKAKHSIVYHGYCAG